MIQNMKTVKQKNVKSNKYSQLPKESSQVNNHKQH